MRPRVLALCLATLLLAAGCALGTSSPTPAPTGGSTSAAPTEPASQGPISPVAGVVTSVDPPRPPESSGSPRATGSPTRSTRPVVGFTLETSGGETLTFALDKLDDTSALAPADLYDRLASQDPILVFFKVVDGKLVVYHIEDAG